MPRKMTPEEIRAFLSHGTRTAKVATSGPGGQPHVMPVWFALDGEELVFTTWGDSVKGRNLRRNPRAAIVVDEEVAPYAFVHIRGPVTLSEDLEELLRFRHGDRRPVHGRRPSRGVRPPKRRAGRAAGAAPSGACDRDSGRRWLLSRGRLAGA
jgi:PPOX class probable F420-dependent enzyme